MLPNIQPVAEDRPQGVIGSGIRFFALMVRRTNLNKTRGHCLPRQGLLQFRVWQYFAALPLVVVLVVALPASTAGAGEATVQIGWLSHAIKRSLPLSYLDQPPQDEGIQGARLGIADDETTGRFTGQSFVLV